jgi:hypothetical protein
MLQITGRRRKAWSQQHQPTEARFMETFGLLLQEVRDEELASLTAQIERELASLFLLEAIAQGTPPFFSEASENSNRRSRS